MISSIPAVDIDGFSKRFGDLTAVDKLTLQIQPGEVVAFPGPNRAGKASGGEQQRPVLRPRPADPR